MHMYTIEYYNKGENMKKYETIKKQTFPEAVQHAYNAKNKKGFMWKITSIQCQLQ
jgi:hypothetical protein